MKDQFIAIKNFNDTGVPMVQMGIAITQPKTDSAELLLPILSSYGPYEDLRTEMHKVVDDMFDAVQGKGKYKI